MSRYRQLSPDGSECGCLKAIAVFKPGNLITIIINNNVDWLCQLNSAYSQALMLLRYLKIIIHSILFLFVMCIETGGLSEVRPVELMQDQAQCILADYVRHRYKTFTKIFDPIIFE
jgi:nuclear receptor subfamily 2 group A